MCRRQVVCHTSLDVWRSPATSVCPRAVTAASRRFSRLEGLDTRIRLASVWGSIRHARCISGGELRGMMTSRLAALKHGPERGACGCPRSSRSSRRRWTLRLAYVPSFHARFWTSCPVTRGPIDVKCVICVTVSCQQFRGAVSGQVPPRCHHRDAPSTSSAKWEIAEPDSFHSGRKQVSNLSHRTADRAGVRLSVLSGPRIRSFHRQGTEHPSPRTSKSTNEGRVRSRIIWVLPDHRRPALADRLDIGQGPIELPSAEGRLCWDRSGWFLLRTTGPESCNRIVSR